MAFIPTVPDLCHDDDRRAERAQPEPQRLLPDVEGGAVDWMGHANDMPRFIEEQIDFNAASPR
jgi:alkaline phosphatase